MEKITFRIKRANSLPTSSQEHVLSPSTKAFRVAAPKMNKGDSIHVSEEQRARIFNFLRFRKLKGHFKSRVISNQLDAVAIYCIKPVLKSQLV